MPLAGLLGGCTVYDHFFHPHRLGNPPMTASAKKKAHEQYKATHKPTSLAPAEETIKGDKADTEPAAAADGAAGKQGDDSKKQTYGDLSENIRNTYNRELLLKKGFVQRAENNGRQLHHYAKARPAHNDASEAARHHRHYVRVPKPAADEAAPASAGGPPAAAGSKHDPIRSSAAHLAPVVAAKVKPKREPAPPKAAATTPVKPTSGVGKLLVRPTVVKAKPTKPLNGDGRLVRRVVVKPAPVKPNAGAFLPPTRRLVAKPAPVKPNAGVVIPPTHRTVAKPVAVKPAAGAFIPPTHRTVTRPVPVKPSPGMYIPPTHRVVALPTPVKPAEGMYLPPTHQVVAPRPAGVKSQGQEATPPAKAAKAAAPGN